MTIEGQEKNREGSDSIGFYMNRTAARPKSGRLHKTLSQNGGAVL
jgi:hypothetical protein